MGFGRELDFKDIYEHITVPEKLLVLRDNKIKAMASYNTQSFCGFKSLIVEGIAIHPGFQGNGIFKDLTTVACSDHEVVCLRTQNPFMYRALEKFCRITFPSENRYPKQFDKILQEFAEYLKCSPNENKVIKNHYGGLFYGKEPTHPKISKFFRETLCMNLNNGDAVLVGGLI